MLEIYAEEVSNTCTLHLRGRIVRGPETDKLRDAAFKTESSVVILDLAHVDVIDAAGLGALLNLREWTNSKGIEFRLKNVTQLVQQVFDITCLDSVFVTSIEPSVRAASIVVETTKAASCGSGMS